MAAGGLVQHALGLVSGGVPVLCCKVLSRCGSSDDSPAHSSLGGVIDLVHLDTLIEPFQKDLP